MRTIETTERAGDDGTLRLEIPGAAAGRTYRVIVVLEEETTAKAPPATSWPEGERPPVPCLSGGDVGGR